MRSGFAVLLRSADDIEVVGEAANGREAVDLVAHERPDVVLMDIRMPEMDGLEATRQITGDESAETRVLILTTFDLDEYVFEALRAGASGFLLKDTLPEELLAAVRVVAEGEALLAPESRAGSSSSSCRNRRSAAPSTHGRASTRSPTVSARCSTPWRAACRTRRSASELFMSHATAKTHVSRLLTKLDARDRAQLVMLAYESGWRDGGPGCR